tara:strand:+ start:2526 stop:2750 length:225 start_codon:yes stop_codon:yes gene_type:complete
MLRRQIQEKYIPENNIPEIAEPEVVKIARVTSFESKLDNNSFDPSKFSPPNDFLLKLRERISNYETNDFMLNKK